jgi:hypothetical protein
MQPRGSKDFSVIGDALFRFNSREPGLDPEIADRVRAAGFRSRLVGLLSRHVSWVLRIFGQDGNRHSPAQRD